MRRSHSEEERENDGRLGGGAGSRGAPSFASSAGSGGVKGMIFSGVSAGVALSDKLVEVVVKRVPQFVHVASPCGFIIPQIGQRTSVDGINSAAQFLQNLLFGLLGVPHCGQ
jgi:hypothetical protein